MFGFGKKQSAEESAKVENIQPPSLSEVYVMPEKYIVKDSGGNNKSLIIVSIILVMVIILTVSYFFYDIISRQNTVVTPQPEPPIIEIIEQPIVEIPVLTTTTDSTTTIDLPLVEASTTTSTLEIPSASLVISLDTDNDGLTNVEETVFGTLPTNADTDGDGFKDGIEVSNGYNPSKPGSSKLNESPFIVSLTTNFGADDYQLLYPKEWQSSVINSSQQLLLSVPSGEVIKISIRSNQQGMSALAWYLQDHPEVAVSQLKIIGTQDGQLAGISSPDGLTAYLTDVSKTKFYIFEYLIGRATEIRYPAIFSMIINNVKVLPKKVTPVPVFEPSNGSVFLPKSQCASGLTFCQLNPCGLLADGSNSCDEDIQGYCYSKECVADADCVTGKTCQPLECFSGDVSRGIKLCK